MKITTNNVPRDTTDAWELTPDERKEFDYLDWAKIDAGEDSASFVRYRGDVLDLGTFMRVNPGGELAGAGWQGVASDSYSSGTLVRYVAPENEQVVIGFYYA